MKQPQTTENNEKKREKFQQNYLLLRATFWDIVARACVPKSS